MDTGVAAACQTDVGSRGSSGRPLLDEVVLRGRRIGRVECGAEAVPFTLCESNPAADHHCFRFASDSYSISGLGDYERFELIPAQALDSPSQSLPRVRARARDESERRSGGAGVHLPANPLR